MHPDENVFRQIPWCARLLAAPNLRIHVPASRTPKPLTGEDSLYASSLNTKDTFSAALTFHPRPEPDEDHIVAASTLVLLGEGLNGFPSVLHGGIVATLIDEAMGILLSVDADREHMRAVSKGHKQGEIAEGMGAYTAELNVKYLAQVKTPGVVLVKARVTKREGSKIWLRATCVQKSGLKEELDGRLVECAVGEAVFVVPRAAKL